MANVGDVLSEEFPGKLPTSENIEFDLKNTDYQELIKYQQHNVNVVSAIRVTQDIEDVIMGLQDSTKLIVTFSRGIACNYWKEFTNKFQLDD